MPPRDLLDNPTGERPAIPSNLLARPKWNGYPIPYVTAYGRGKPDFTGFDPGRLVKCAASELCSMCGLPLKLSGESATLLGANSLTRHFRLPPAHESCMLYMTKACPWIKSQPYTIFWVKSWFADDTKTGPLIRVYDSQITKEEAFAPESTAKS